MDSELSEKERIALTYISHGEWMYGDTLNKKFGNETIKLLYTREAIQYREREDGLFSGKEYQITEKGKLLLK